MATALQCPQCDARLKLTEALEPGQEIECPRCGLNFAPPKSKDERPRPPKAKSRSGDDEENAPVRRPRSRREDDQDDTQVRRPRSRREDDQDDTQARRPRSRRDDDDDGDDAPRKRRSAPTRSRRDDDDDDDNEQRVHSARDQQDRKLGMLIGVGLAGGLLLFVAVVGVGVYLVLGNDKKPEVAADAKPVAADNTGQGGASNPESRPADPDARPANLPVAPEKGPASAQLLSRNAELPKDVEEKIRRATVYVEVSFGDSGASGSGFIVRSNEDVAYVVTNHHVIAADNDPPEKEPAPARPGIGRPPGFPGRPPGFPGRPPGFPGRPPGFGPPGRQPEPKKVETEIIVQLYRGTPQQATFPAKVVAIDPEADLAVLRIDGGRNYPAPIDLATEAELVEFTPVRIFGFPLGRKDLMVSSGVASQLVRNAHGELTDIQLNIKKEEVTHGSSGGPVVDAVGRLVGVTVAGIGEKSLGWAVPTTKLAHMFRGSLNGGVLYQFRQKGAAVAVAGEAWRFDRQNRVETRKPIDVTIDGKAPIQGLPLHEFHAVAFLTDPMKKIRSVQVLYVVNRSDSVVRVGTGWGALRDAQKVEMTLTERSAEAVLKLPDGSSDELYAVQFAYIDGAGKTLHTEPHPVRFTFPKSLKTATVAISGVKDDATRRFIGDSLKSLVPGGGNITQSHTPNGLNVTIEPVEDPKALADRIKFGTVTVSGWNISVKVDKVELPLPSVEEVNKALSDLRSNDNQVRIGAADRLAKCYTVLPNRREEVAKALTALAVSQEFWASRAGLNALKIWAGPEVVKDLVAYLEKANVGQPQGDVIALIAPHKDPAAAKALARCLNSGFNRGPAAAALKAIGSKAEKEVFPVLEEKDGWTVREACLVLKEIGTKESIAPLQALLDKKPDFLVAPAAKEALKAVQDRNPAE